MKRRSFLAGATLATVGVAGCTSSDTGYDDKNGNGTDYIWEHSIPGENLVVTEGRAFGDYIADGVFALDLQTGDQQWTFGSSHAKSRYTTPIVKDAVYVTKWDDMEYSWPFVIEFDGTERWSGSKDEAIRQVADGVAYLEGLEAENGEVAKIIKAVDTTTGDELWTYPGSSVELDTTDGESPETVYVVGNELVALDSTNGNVRWRYEHGDAEIRLSVVSDGVAYLTLDSQSLDSESIVAVSDGEALWRTDSELEPRVYGIEAGNVIVTETSVSQSSNHQVYALHGRTGEQQWKLEIEETYEPKVIVHEGRVYVYDEQVVAYSVDDGSEIWVADNGTEVSDADIDGNRVKSIAVSSKEKSSGERSVLVQIGKNKLHRITPDGDVVQKWTVEGEINDFAMGEFILISTDAGIYALEQ